MKVVKTMGHPYGIPVKTVLKPETEAKHGSVTFVFVMFCVFGIQCFFHIYNIYIYIDPTSD